MNTSIYAALTLFALCNTVSAQSVFPQVTEKIKAEKEIEEKKHEMLLKETKKTLILFDKEVKKLDNELKKELLSVKSDEVVNLLVALPSFHNYKILYDELQASTGTYQSNASGDAIYSKNGKYITEDTQKVDVSHKQASTLSFLNKQHEHRKEIALQLQAYLKERGIASSLDEETKDFSFFTVKMTRKEAISFLKNNSEFIRSIGVNGGHDYSIDSAMIATRVNPVVLSWTPQRNNQRGGGIGIYNSDAQCPDAATEVEGLYHEFNSGVTGDASLDVHTFLITGILASAAPDAFKYCKNGRFDLQGYPGVLPTVAELNSNPTIEVETYSLNRNDANSNVYTTEDSLFDEHVRSSNNIVFISAGNHSTTSSNVVESPAKAYNIITVGNYNDSANPISIYQTSNFGNPEVGNEKPELTAPGTNISYTFNGRTESGTGTSFATPHAAAIAADIMSENPFLQYNNMAMKAMMLASATDTIADDSNAITSGDSAVGAGGINVQSGIYNDRFAAYWYDPNGNGPFNRTSTNSCYDGWTFSASQYQSHVRIALTWVINEEYVLENNTHGNVLYFYVTDNDGNYVAVSHWDSKNNWQQDNWAVTEFDPQNNNDTYRLHVCRYNPFSTDLDSELNMGVAVTSW